MKSTSPVGILLIVLAVLSGVLLVAFLYRDYTKGKTELQQLEEDARLHFPDEKQRDVILGILRQVRKARSRALAGIAT